MPTKLKTEHCYVNKQFGMFRVGDVSKNGILVTIWDTKNDRSLVLFKYLLDATEVPRTEYFKELKPNLVLYNYAW